jgi:hypothetical protein
VLPQHKNHRFDFTTRSISNTSIKSALTKTKHYKNSLISSHKKMCDSKICAVEITQNVCEFWVFMRIHFDFKHLYANFEKKKSPQVFLWDQIKVFSVYSVYTIHNWFLRHQDQTPKAFVLLIELFYFSRRK